MIVVTTPTGQIGSQVVEDLLDAAASIRLVARDPAKVSANVRERAKVVTGSHGDEPTVEEAFSGADAVFWLPPPNPSTPSLEAVYADFVRPAAGVFVPAGVKRVVGITALGRGTPQSNRAGLVTASLAMDDVIAQSGVAYRAVANPSFFDNLLRQVEPIATKGMFFSAVDPARKLPACATRDIAATATRLLLDEHWTGIDQVAVLGPEDLSFEDMAAIMSDVLGTPIRCQRTSYEDYQAQFLKQGMSEAMAAGMTDMARAKSEGLDNAEPRTAENTTPTSFRQWCEEELAPAVRKAAAS